MKEINLYYRYWFFHTEIDEKYNPQSYINVIDMFPIHTIHDTIIRNMRLVFLKKVRLIDEIV